MQDLVITENWIIISLVLYNALSLEAPGVKSI